MDFPIADIESIACSAHPAFLPEGAAVFELDGADSAHRLTVVMEVRRSFLQSFDAQAAAQALRQAVSEKLNVRLGKIVFLKPGKLPRSAAGKIQRQACKDLFVSGALEVLAEIEEAADTPVRDTPQEIPRKTFALTPLQRAIWAQAQAEPSSALNIVRRFHIQGALDVDALDKSFQELLRRHDALRMRFSIEDGEPRQRVDTFPSWKLSVVDVSDRNADEVEQAIAKDANFIFDLSTDDLFRVSLYEQAQQEYGLIVCAHGIVIDEESIAILMGELSALYSAYAVGGSAALTPPKQYVDYTQRLQSEFSTERLAADAEFWQVKLAGSAPAYLPADRLRPAANGAAACVRTALDQELTKKIRALCETGSVSPSVLFAAAFATLLSRYAGSEDICIALRAPSGRTNGEDTLVGAITGSTLLRANFDGDPAFDRVLASASAWLAETAGRRALPTESLRESAQAPVLHTPDAALKVRAPAKLQLHGLTVRQGRVPLNAIRRELELDVIEAPENFYCEFAYRIALFDEATVRRFAASFVTLMQSLAQSTAQPVQLLPILSGAERQGVLEFGKAESGAAFEPALTHALFEKQAAATPDAVALCFDDAALSYAQLNERANRVAHYLVAQGVKPDMLVGLCAERSLDLVVGLLGILKAGGAYVALDPAYPRERLRFLLNDSGVKLVLTQSAVAKQLPVTDQRCILLDDQSLFHAQPVANIAAQSLGLTPESLAYIVYTSGSTGNPKASLLMHKGLSNLALAQKDVFEVQPSSRVIQFASFAFDAATSEIFMALAAGASLHLVTKELTQSGMDLSDYVAQRGITHATLPPALLPVLEPAKWRTVQHLVVAGEHCPLPLVQQWSRDRHFYNAYGPSEATVCASIGKLTPHSQVVHMGKPMRGVTLYVLDRHLQPAPIGVAGQLYVGGIGVGRGYLGREELTREKFIDNPYGDGKLYATGDSVRWLADGNLEFIGRIDNQVKLRGYRIELGEIEATLARQQGVLESAVVVHGDKEGKQRLVAYLVVNGEFTNTEAVRKHLGELLPSYMVPSTFILIDKLPMTPNGKVDKKALPPPDAAGSAKQDYVAPRNASEEGLAKIWTELLGVQGLGVRHNFFDLGGNSLVAAQAAARIKENFGVQLKVAELFALPTIEQLAQRIAEAPKQKAADGIQVLPRDRKLSLSYAQQQMWLVNKIDGNSAQYNLPSTIDFKGKLNIPALESALAKIVERHEILRTVYEEHDGTPYQVIREHAAFALSTEDLSSMSHGEQAIAVRAFCEKEALKPFDLTRDLMLRAALLKLSDERYTLVLNMHHIAGDGWSAALIRKELTDYYQAALSKTAPSLPALNCQYADYASWQRAKLAAGRVEQSLSYWRGKLAGTPTVHSLPLDYARPMQPSYKGGVVTQEIPAKTVQNLQRLARDKQVTLFMLMHAAFASLLHRYSGESDIVVGTPVANRDAVELESLVGFFVNTVVLRSDFSDDRGFASFLEQSKTEYLATVEHQAIPFELLVNELNPERSAAFNPIFQIMLAFQNYQDHRLELAELDVSEGKEIRVLSNFDLTLNVAESKDGLTLSWIYAKDLFVEATVNRMAQSFAVLLNAVADAPDCPIKQLPLLNDAAWQTVVDFGNAQVGKAFEPICSHVLFEQWADRLPDAIALQFMGEKLSYRELNERANRMAHYLAAQGVAADSLVGICVDRSPEMIVALLAVLKAGGAYVALDPTYPAERLRYQLEDSGVKLVVAQKALSDKLPLSGQALIFADEPALFEAQPVHNLPPASRGLTPESLAYVIYTSGSTGKPKASLLMHKGLSNLAQTVREYFHVDETSNVIQFASFAFDAATWEIFMALGSGACLHIVPKTVVQSGSELSAYVWEHRITHATLPPALLPVLERGKWITVGHLIVAGEHCPMNVVQEWAKGRSFYNAYGPSETTVCASMGQLTHESETVHMGKPIRGVELHVLDALMCPVPVGVAGQLFVGGAGVGRGYLGREQLNREKFVPNPFGAGKLYATGDLVRWLNDGNLEYLGRIDDQVKIRGFRIELGEIEAALTAIPEVRECIVLAREDEPGDKRLVAYVVPHEKGKLDIADLRARLGQSLPAHMVPSYLVQLDAMPLNANGKIDRKALPQPQGGAASSREYEAPVGPVETALAAIWMDLLKLERVSRLDNFFELGGHSLLAVALIERMRRQGMHAEVRTLFTAPTLAALARAVSGGKAKSPAVPANAISADCTAITPDMLPLVTLTQAEIDGIIAVTPGGVRNIQDIYALAPLQEGILFHHLLSKEGDAYLTASRLAFDSRERLDTFLQAWQCVIDRHDILRTAILWEGLSAPVQVVRRKAALAVEQVELSAGGDAAEELKQRFDPRHFKIDVRQAPMMRAYIAEDKRQGRWLLHLVFHHLAFDHTSLDVVLEEILAHIQNRADRLPPPMPFRNFVAQVRLGRAASEHEAFFKRMLGKVEETTAPFGLADVQGDGTAINEATLALEPALAARLRERAGALGVSVASLCHLAWAQVLARTTAREDVVFGTVLFGRMDGGEGSDRALGLFINTLPLKLTIDATPVEKSARQAHALLAELLNHEHAPLVLAQRCSAVPPPAPLFSSILNYRHSANDSLGSAELPPGFGGISVLPSEERTNYPFGLSVDDLGDGFSLNAQVDRSVDAMRICEFMATALQALVDALEQAPQTPIDTLDVLPSAEREQMLLAWNRVEEGDMQAPAYAHVLFEEQARKTPDAVALSFKGETMTYAQLNERANQAAHYLVALGVRPDTLVGICIDRSPEMVIALLATLKAGGAYVALDPAYPTERLRYLLEDSGVDMVLAQTTLAGILPLAGQRIVFIDNKALFDAQQKGDIAAESRALTPNSLAYVIYTSGSTGKPKACMLEHKGLANMALGHRDMLHVDGTSRLLQFSSISFDVATCEIFTTLCAGGALHLIPKALTQSGMELSEYVEAAGITHALLPPALLAVVDRSKWECVKHLVVGGESIALPLMKQWALGRSFYNAYGPSETTVCASMAKLDAGSDVIHMGKPMRGVQLYVLDKRLQPCPIGVPGQLYIGGTGVGRGYLGREELTQQKFIDHPFGDGKLYASGDLVRWRADGNIEFIGRIDNQVKIRGYRIELGEIESVLSAQQGVLENTVIAHADKGGKLQLVAYLVADDSFASVEQLRTVLAEMLPNYMVPSAFMLIERMPLTANGKVDKKALPAPDANTLTKQDFVAPSTPAEEKLARIWCELLGLEKVGVQHNFFELGGHSLLAIQVISRIKEAFGVQLKVAELFSHVTVAEQAALIAESAKDDGGLPPIAPRQEGNVLPLTLEQQSYWFLYELEGGTATYNMPFALHMSGELHPALLERSFQAMIQRHESLRTVFSPRNGEPFQQVIDNVEWKLSFDADKHYPSKDAVRREIEKDAQYVFDLKSEIPVRAALYRVAQNDHVLTILLHHSMADGWSLDLFVHELAEIYNALCAGRPDPLKPLPIQYGDYAVWQKTHFVGEVYEKEVAYWRDKLKGLPPMISLPTDYPRPAVQSYRGKEVHFALPLKLSQSLNAFARKNNTTLYNTMLAALNVLLSRYGRTDDIAVGTAIANRSRPNLESLVGCFANTIVIRTKLAQELSFADLVKRVDGTVFEAYEHSSIPFDVVVDAVQPMRSLGVPPIFQVMFRLHNLVEQGMEFNGVNAEMIPIESESAKLDLNLSLIEKEGCINGMIEYATDLFSEKTVERIAKHYQLLLESAMTDPAIAIERLAMLSKEEFELVEKWNSTDKAYPQDECVYQLFEQTAARVPDKIAYVMGETRYTYRELNERANRLAHYLQSQGVGPEMRVGVSTGRTPWAAVCMLAVFKSGGIYVPLDPNYPKERIDVMLDVVKPKIILTRTEIAGLFEGVAAQVVCLDQAETEIAGQAAENPPAIGADHSAYILFTSGTTGKPKAILIGHRAFRNMPVAHEWAHLHTQNSRVLQFASLSFSISMWDSFMAWVPGGTVVAVTQEENLPGEPLYELLEREQVTHATWPVSLLSTVPVERMPRSLHTVISSAEPCNDAVVARWTARGVRFLNMYGNSEISLGSTIYEYHKVGQKLTIGVAFPNTRMYLLDKYLRQVPIGVIAEIHTAGAGLATCYWDNPVATAKSFIPNPFAHGKADRLYKTGDLGRYLPNGEIEFIGREDFQVSIRGFRVELVEIENLLRTAPEIGEVVVVSQPDKNQVGRLVCFYVEKEGMPSVDVAKLRALVSRKLPSYMVPSLFVRLDAMPLTPNRKIDRFALPKPTLDDSQETEYIAPRTELEKAVAAIWSEVLGLEAIGIDRNFFEVGGHSLLAVQVVARIKDKLGLPVTIKDLFVHATIETLAAYLSQVQASGETALPPIAKRETAGLIPLSLDQKPYWFLHQLEGGSYTYNIPLAMRLYGSLDLDAFKQALHAVIDRHEALRTVFPVHDGEPAQKIVKQPAIDVPLIGVTDDDVLDVVAADFMHVFDLERELPIRVRLLKIADDHHVFTLVIHHVVADGWSLGVLMGELIKLYNDYHAGRGNTLTPLALQYGDYSQWQQVNVLGRYYDSQIAFWKNKLKGLAPLLNLPLDYPRPPVQSYRGNEIPFALRPDLAAKLNKYARQHNTTLFNLLLSGLAILLSRYGRTDDIPIGTAIANRPQKELEPLVGCFANTLVIRCKVDPKENFQHLVANLGNEALESFSHGSVPFDGVVEAVQPERSLGVPPIFQVMFRLHTQDMSQKEPFAELNNELITLPSRSAKLDLNVSLRETEDGLAGVIEYATDLFSEQTIKRIAEQYQATLDAAIADTKLPIEKLSVLTKAEMEQVERWNQTDMPYPQDECMHHLFERTVERMPNKLAYVSGKDRFTYAELNARANRLAHFLQSRGVGPEIRVGVAVERSTWAGISGLAVAKSAGTYVPIDVNYPKDRIERMLEVAKPRIILTLSHLKPLFADTGAEIVALDTEWTSIQSQPISNPPRIGADHSAYILFTSGTTGKPKGILVGNRAFRNMANAQQWAGLHSPDNRVLQFASLSFSISFWGTYMAWIPGGTLYSVTAEQGMLDEPLYQYMEECQITHVTWPVSVLSTIPIERVPKSLHTVISSAEPCNDAVVEKWTKRGVRFLNLYGNSEVAIGSTLYEYRQVGQKLTIGKALPNTKMYLLDEQLRQVPIGVIAEIHTAGAGVATGYVDNPEATAKSFIPNPFSDDTKSRLYKTGDLGRYLPNGEIEFIGREDFQVSIRGFRIELVEIENVLRAVPGMLEVVAVARNDQQGVARLVCFYTQDKSLPPFSSAQLRKIVGEKLPNYMVPSLFVQLEAMPLTPNRKIDRFALPETFDGEESDDTYLAPTSPTEKKLAEIWSGILDIQDIGVRHNFFELGGHSLLATKIVARVRTEFKVEITLQEFFENATIESLAKIISRAKATIVDHPIKRLTERGRAPLSFAQQRLWFLDRYEENSNFYHMPAVLKIVGKLDADALGRAFAAIIDRHEALRTNFVSQDGQAYQVVRPAGNWEMRIVDLLGSRAEKEAAFDAAVRAQLHTSFDLEHDELIRVVLFNAGDGEYRLFVNMHHIICDGWSITVLVNELAALYAAYADNAPLTLEELPVQYIDFAAWQSEYLQGEVLAEQSRYWTGKLRKLSTLPLPTDFERPKNQTYNGDRVSFALRPDLVAKLEDLSNQQGATMFMTLLAAFNILLSRYANHNDICIGTPIANRVRPEIEPLIGFFANTLVLRSDLDGDPRFVDLLQQVKKTTLGAYSHQDIPFEKVVDLVLPERDPSRSPLFQVSFALQKFADRSVLFPGMEVSEIALDNKTSKFDIVLEFFETDHGLESYIEYNTDLFKAETIRGYADALQGLLESIVAAPQDRLSALSVIGAKPQLATLDLDAYPILRAVYANAAHAANANLVYALLDDAGNPVPQGMAGNLYLDSSVVRDTLGNDAAMRKLTVDAHTAGLALTGFKARAGRDGLQILKTPEDVALIAGRLVYPRELEQVLLAKPGIQDCHISAREHARLGSQLVAYLVCESEPPALEELDRHLAENGQEQVRLFATVKVAAIPLTKHGEVDIRQLEKLPVYNQQSLAGWSQAVKGMDKVMQAVIVPEVLDERQSVSHLLDLLPNTVNADAAAADIVRKHKRAGNDSLSSVPALVVTGRIAEEPGQPKLLADMLINTALSHPDKPIRFYHADNSRGEFGYAELLRRAQCVLTGLREAGLTPDTKVIFQFDRNEDFVCAFWACQLGGFIPVPIAAAKTYRSSNAQTAKIAHAWKMMDKAVVLAGANIVDGVRDIAELENIENFDVHDISAMYEHEPAKAFHKAEPDDVALIMLTSGSTGMPKGVQLSHRNLIGRTLGSAKKNGFHADMVSLNWMALDHVGGIIYFHIRDVHLAAEQIQADTDYILADPLRWLELIDRHRVNITWAPNFAFSLIVDRKDELAGASFDLSCMRFMLNGAEAVVPKTTQAFIDLLQPFNLDENSVKPVYGMSEISSGVTYAQRLRLTYGSDDTLFVSVGSPIPGVNMRIVDQNDQVMMEGQSGRLQVSGVTVTKGYLGVDNKDVFTADGWFKTGDLAFIQDGELTITGREKDIIIINGVNFYGHEIAEVVEAVPGVAVSYAAACAVRRSGSNSDQLAIFFHTALQGDALSALMRQIRQSVIEKIGANPSYIIPVDKERIPKTEIGKIQLAKLAQAFNKGEFDSILRAMDIAERNEHTLPDWFFSKRWAQRQAHAAAHVLPAGATLIFADRSGCADKLQLQGTCVKVVAGANYRESEDGYQINPAMREHYVRLVQSLAERQIRVRRVISLWDYDAAVDGKQAALARPVLSDAAGLYSAWYLAQAYASQNHAEPMQWLWCARSAQRVDEDDAVSPDKAATLALLKTLAKEFSWLSSRHIDFAGDDSDGHAQLLSKEAFVLCGDDEVAYREARRFVLRLQREQLAQNQSRSMPIVQGGAYLISGGLGGIGVELAKLLLKQFGAKILLIGRTAQEDLAQEKQQTLAELSKMGSVVYAAADICNQAAVESAADRAELEWQQKLAGVFHLAGLAHEEAMAEQSIQSLHQAVRAKTMGTRVLYKLCDHRSDTLFVNFSSVNAQFGGSGRAAYSIANRYQEAFVEALRANRNVDCYCIAWSLWHDTGMGKQYLQAESLSRGLGFTPIPAAKGMSSLLAVLYHGKRNVFAGLDDTRATIRRRLPDRQFKQQLLCYFTSGEANIANRIAADVTLADEFAMPLQPQFVQVESMPVTPSGEIDVAALRRSLAQAAGGVAEKIAPRDEMEAVLTKIATQVFGAAEPIGIRDNFFDVGANSLLIVKMHHEIQQQLDIEFAMVELFNSTTVEKLAKFLSAQGGAAEPASADDARSAGQDRRAAMQRRNRAARGRRTA